MPRSKRRRIPAFSVVTLLLCVPFFILFLSGCTARPLMKSTMELQALQKDQLGNLEIAAVIVDRPDDPNFFMKKPFKNLNMVALKLRIGNTGRHNLLIKLNDIALISKDKNKYYPLTKEQAASRASGPLGIYQLFTFGKVGHGYYANGLDKQINLEPGEDISGYVFYKVYKRHYEAAVNGELQVMAMRVQEIDKIQYTSPLEKGR